MGNRCDEENKSELSLGKATLWGRKHNIQVFEVSAKGGRNVKEAILALIKEISGASIPWCECALSALAAPSTPTALTPSLPTIVQGEAMASPRSGSASASFLAMKSRFERSETGGTSGSEDTSEPALVKSVPTSPPQRTRTKSLSSKALPIPPRTVTPQLQRAATSREETREDEARSEGKDKEEKKKKKHKWPF